MIAEPGYPNPNTIDMLLSDPEKQDMTRKFFTQLDAEKEALGSSGYTTGKVFGEEARGYPARITENGLLFELYVSERSLPPLEEVDITRATAQDVAIAATRYLQLGTTIGGGLIDLNKGEQNYVSLSHINLTGWNKLDQVINVGNCYKGDGALFLFGHHSEATITSLEQVAPLFGQAMADKSADDSAAGFRQLMDELMEQGAYLLPVSFRNIQDSGGNTTRQAMNTGYVQSQMFSVARKRNGFEL